MQIPCFTSTQITGRLSTIAILPLTGTFGKAWTGERLSGKSRHIRDRLESFATTCAGTLFPTQAVTKVGLDIAMFQ